MATLKGLIPVTVGTVEAYDGGAGGGGIPLGGGGAGNAERRTIYTLQGARHPLPPPPPPIHSFLISLAGLLVLFGKHSALPK